MFCLKIGRGLSKECEQSDYKRVNVKRTYLYKMRPQNDGADQIMTSIVVDTKTLYPGNVRNAGNGEGTVLKWVLIVD